MRRVRCLYFRALRTGAAPVSVPSEFLTEIHEKAARKTIRSLVMAGELARIMSNFGAEGVTAIAFKGPTLAYLAYGGRQDRHAHRQGHVAAGRLPHDPAADARHRHQDQDREPYLPGALRPSRLIPTISYMLGANAGP